MEVLKKRTAVECAAGPQPAGGESLLTLMKQGSDDVELKVGGVVGDEA